MDSPDEDEEPKQKFNLFVKYSDRSAIGIFSTVNLAGDWSLHHEYPLDRDIVTMRSIPLKNNLFTLSYAREPDAQEFAARLALSSSPYATLSNPPIMLKFFSMCGLDNMIYAHDCIGEYERYSDAIAGFSSGEIKRGIYAFNTDTSFWQPMPAMDTRVSQCMLTNDDDLVYAVGGQCNKFECKDSVHGHVQAYDRRTNKWQTLPSTKFFYGSCYSDAVVCNGKLFVVSTDHITLEVYDITAGKWYHHKDRQVVRANSECQCRQAFGITYPYGRCCLRPYQNTLYKFGLGTQENPIWEFNQVGCYFCRISLLHEKITRIKKYSEIYDVVLY